MGTNDSATVAQTLMDSAVWNGKMYANGWQESANGTLEVTDKSTGQVLGKTASASRADICEAGETAQVAAKEWARTPADHRAAIVRRAGDLLT